MKNLILSPTALIRPHPLLWRGLGRGLFLLFLFLRTVSAHAQVIVNCAGGGSTGLGDGGPAIDAELITPFGIALDDSGNLYICDALRIRKVSPGYGGTITTIAGNGTGGYSGDHGLGIYAQISGTAIDVAIDHYGNVYIADAANNCIRKITPADTITTIAGTGIAGYNGDGIPATSAQLNLPTGVAVDSIGNIYIADRGNRRIRKVDTSGIITTIAGTGVAGFSPDGSRADTAKLDLPFSIRMDKAGSLFFYDSARIRKIDTGGVITTIAGNGLYGFSGDSGLATSAEIGGGAIAIDSLGDLFFADVEFNHIRKVDTAGIIYTIAGNGMSGGSGDNGNPLLAELRAPQGVAIDNTGIYISDNGNNRVRLVTKHPVYANSVLNALQEISVAPNPSSGVFRFMIPSNADEQAQISVINILGEKIKEFVAVTNQQVQVMLNVSPGVYFLSATTIQQQYNVKIIVW